MDGKNENERGGLIYRGFRNYVIMINSLYFPKIYSQGVENLPKPGLPTLLVGNLALSAKLLPTKKTTAKI